MVDSNVAGSRVEIYLPLGIHALLAARSPGFTGHAVSIRLILADDHPFILDALEGLFRLEEDIEVVARCTDGVQAIEAVREREAGPAHPRPAHARRRWLAVMRALRDMGSKPAWCC